MIRAVPSLFLCLGLLSSSEAPAQDLGAAVLTNTSGAVTNVVFRVWAPNAVAVHVAGDFNGWITNSGTALIRTNVASGIWSGSSTNARPGHAYKYAITASNSAVLWKKDPRARQVRTLTGGVPSYVTNGSSQQASVVYNANAFDWTGDTFIPPRPEDVVMYEMHVGTFYDPTPFDGQPATFDDAIQKLDYLKGLGINMIALMPVQEFNGRHSWGYNPSDPFAIEETYGGPDAFKRFVKAAHQKGMAVQVDVVHNHYGDLAANTNAWTSLKTSDLENFDGGEPYFYNAGDESGTNARVGISKTKWGPRPRYSDTNNVQAYILDNIKMYLDEYKVWALRWDSPRNITGYQANPGAVVGDPNAPIPEAVAMMTNIHAEIRSTNRPNSGRYYSIAEDANSPGGYHAHWEISYHDAIFSRLLLTNHPPTGTTNDLPPPFNKKYTNNDPTMGNLRGRIENKEDPGFRVTFLENHDKSGHLNVATDGKRLAHDFDTNNPASTLAKRKTLMAAAATLASAGTPMLWMGQEQLADGDFNDKYALDWGRARQFPGILRFHRDMVYLRNSLPALRTASTNTNQSPFVAVVHTNQTSGLLAFRRHDGVSSNNDVLVVMNFSPSNSVLPSASLAGGFNRVLLNSESTNYDPVFTNSGAAIGASIATNTNLSMPPWSVAILGKTSLALPAIDANSNGIDDGIDLLTGNRAALAGTFNNWDTNSLVMKWDTNRRVYWFVSRFLAPGTNEFRAFTTNWAPGTNFNFVNNGPSTWHIVFNPSNNTYAATNLGAATNTPPADWKSFWFGSTNVSDGADEDGDGWNNLQEFQRGSDPTLHEESRFAVVGALNGWAWSNAVVSTNPFQMRYAGHGLWRFFRWFPIGTSDLSFKVAQGPTADDPNWGRADSTATSGFAQFKGTNFSWLTNLEAWQVLTFNERTGQYSIDSFSTNSRDFDSDGMPDEWELFSGLDPTNPGDATADADEDLVQNVLEFRRGSSARDAADHFAAMSMPASAFPFSPEQSSNSWQPSEPRVAMKWNTNDARWHGLRYVPGSQTLHFKFAANNSWSRAWNWRGTNDVPGIALANDATNNIIHQFAQAGYYTVMFDEHSGRYAISNMPAADTNNTNDIADYWEWFHGGSGATVNPDGDIDGDTVLNKFEFARGSDPQNVSDHYSALALPGDTFPFSSASGWNDRTDPRLRMVWRTNTGLWELLRFVPRPASYQVRAANSPFGSGDWAGTAGNQTLNFTSRGYYIVQFEEFSKKYSIASMPTNDTDLDGLADYWESYLRQTNPTADTDADGATALGEFARGSDPENRDRSSNMHVVGHVSGWSFSDVPMRWNNARGVWEKLVFTTRLQVNPQEAKFVHVISDTNGWNNPNWGDGYDGPPLQVPDGWADVNGKNISYRVSALPVHVLFEFEEVWGGYRAGPVTTDTDKDGLPDDWANYYGVTNALADSDGDGRPNIKEFRLAMDPTQKDDAPFVTRNPNMSLAGSFVNDWNEVGTRMTLIDDFVWMIDRSIDNPVSQVFKFNIGNWSRQWGETVANAATGAARGSENIGLPNLGSGSYRFIFNEATLEYTVTRLGTYSGRYGSVPPTQKRLGSGLHALNEYLFGGTVSAPPPPTHLPSEAVVDGRLRMDFVARTDDAKLSHVVETSTDLSSGWTTNGVILISNETADFKSGLLRYIYEAQGSGHSRRFLRIRGTLQP